MIELGLGAVFRQRRQAGQTPKPRWVEPEFGWSAWSPETEGKGIVREAAAAARDWAWDNLGWTTAVSYIDQDNARSIALAERLGAVHDPDGAHPDLDGWEGTLVFRHTPGVSA